MINQNFLSSRNNRASLAITGLLAAVYAVLLWFYFPMANRALYWILMTGQLFYLWQILSFIHTVWDIEQLPRPQVLKSFEPSVDIFITVAGEPVDVVYETVLAARGQLYGRHKVYILNDGFVAGKANWQEIELLAKELGVHCITRKVKGGAKAGNINHALALTQGDLVAIFDADHVPAKNFLRATVPYFSDPKLAFVQTPQYYKNFADNRVTRGAWQQQTLFFGPICRGKNRWNAATMCGTNMLLKRQALVEVGGMATESIAEDLLTGLRMHMRGWNSLYLPKVLAQGYAPFDLPSYSTQQFRWARGSLEIFFRHNPLLVRGLTWSQRIQYVASASFFLSGLIVILSSLLPLVFFFTGLVPVTVSGMILAAVFIPYILSVGIMLNSFSGGAFTYLAVAFSLSSFWIHTKALVATVLRLKNDFVVTPKNPAAAKVWKMVEAVLPHLLFLSILAWGVGVAIFREGLSSALVNNLAWSLWYLFVFTPFYLEAWEYRRFAQKSAEASEVGRTVYAG
jgi:cellulose synthase (UDP-forming)